MVPITPTGTNGNRSVTAAKRANYEALSPTRRVAAFLLTKPCRYALFFIPPPLQVHLGCYIFARESSLALETRFGLRLTVFSWTLPELLVLWGNPFPSPAVGGW